MNHKVLKEKALTEFHYIREYESKGHKYFSFHEEITFHDYRSMPRRRIFRAEDFENFLDFEKFVMYSLIIRAEDDEQLIDHPIKAAVWKDCEREVGKALDRF